MKNLSKNNSIFIILLKTSNNNCTWIHLKEALKIFKILLNKNHIKVKIKFNNNNSKLIDPLNLHILQQMNYSNKIILMQIMKLFKKLTCSNNSFKSCIIIIKLASWMKFTNKTFSIFLINILKINLILTKMN